jgi:2-hydroxychromene-2-carboxylate isomerase
LTFKRQIMFYLDFISPFAYLANTRLPELAARHGATIEYRPVDVMLAKLAAGNFTPSTRSLPAKARFIRRDRLGWAERYGVPMNDPKAFRAPRLNSGLLYAADQGSARAYVDAAFHRVWGLGGDPDDDALLSAVAADAGLQPQSLFDYVHSSPAQLRYQECQKNAYSAGVFGVPMMMVDDQMYWGNDRLDFLDEWLAATGESQGSL